MSGKIYCPTETAVLLASYACVAKYGPYDPKTCPKSLPIDRLIPGKYVSNFNSLLLHYLLLYHWFFSDFFREQYSQTDEQWYETIVSYYKDHHDLSPEEGMVQYLQVAQDLEMYGVEKFNIKNKKHTPLVLGVDALGLSVYQPDNL